MPVYERGYTAWEHSGRRAFPPWWVIARRGIVGPLASRRFLFLIFIAWIPAVVKGTIIFIKTKTGDLLDLFSGGWASIDADGFLSFLEWQRFFVFLFLAIVGARLIAMDRREGGLSLYFSRPLGLADYVGGKLMIVLFYYLLVTLLPVYVLCIFGYLVSSGATGLELLIVIPLQATVYCLVAGSGMGLVLLAMSSLGTRTIFVVVWWAVVYLGSGAVAAIFSLTGIHALDLIGFTGQYHNAGALIFGTEARLDVAPVLSLLVVCAYAVAAITVLRYRIRPVEVVV